MSVQAEVERPFTYLLARCPSSHLQLAYSQTRLHDLKLWNGKSFNVDGQVFNDTVRFFKGILF